MAQAAIASNVMASWVFGWRVNSVLMAALEWISKNDAAKVALLASVTGGFFAFGNQLGTRVWDKLNESSERRCRYRGLLLAVLSESLRNLDAVLALLSGLKVYKDTPQIEVLEAAAKTWLVDWIKENPLQSDSWIRFEQSDVAYSLFPIVVAEMPSCQAALKSIYTTAGRLSAPQLPLSLEDIESLIDDVRFVCGLVGFELMMMANADLRVWHSFGVGCVSRLARMYESGVTVPPDLVLSAKASAQMRNRVIRLSKRSCRWIPLVGKHCDLAILALGIGKGSEHSTVSH